MIKKRIYVLIFTLVHISLLAQDQSMPIMSYQKCEDSKQLDFKPFPIDYKSEFHPHNPVIAEKFILTIPHGMVYSIDGLVVVDNEILKYLIWPNDFRRKAKLEKLDPATFSLAMKIDGKCAVIAQAGGFCYYHWVTEVLGRLALLERQNMEYDFLCVPLSQPYMEESLKLWGIDLDKIIEPYGLCKCIQADELIVPSLVDRVTPDLAPSFANYPSPWILQALRDKFLPKISKSLDENSYSKKIFISRKDAAVRKFTNEDDLFDKLEAQGFKRYCLSELSFLEQIALFNHADVIVGSHGAGLVNLIFSQPGTQVIEIFQARADATYWYLSQNLGLQHTCIQTCEFDFNEDSAGFFDTEITLTAIEKILSVVNLL